VLIGERARQGHESQPHFRCHDCRKVMSKSQTSDCHPNNERSKYDLVGPAKSPRDPFIPLATDNLISAQVGYALTRSGVREVTQKRAWELLRRRAQVESLRFVIGIIGRDEPILLTLGRTRDFECWIEEVGWHFGIAANNVSRVIFTVPGDLSYHFFPRGAEIEFSFGEEELCPHGDEGCPQEGETCAKEIRRFRFIQLLTSVGEAMPMPTGGARSLCLFVRVFLR
jgi:hypothetical protein